MELAWLIFDIDRPCAAFSWEWALLPPPTISVINPSNGHAHLLYGLRVPVGLGNFSRDAPIRFAAAIQAAFTAKLNADVGYVGLISKNPFHRDWKSLYQSKFYDLHELSDYVMLSKNSSRQGVIGLGRNCVLFDDVRTWSYSWVREYKRNQVNKEAWFSVVLAQAEKSNSFQTPLNHSEVRSVAKSVAKWTWRNFNDANFSRIQSERGKLGGRPRSTTLIDIPWEKAGISRATYYRRLSALNK